MAEDIFSTSIRKYDNPALHPIRLKAHADFSDVVNTYPEFQVNAEIQVRRRWLAAELQMGAEKYLAQFASAFSAEENSQMLSKVIAEDVHALLRLYDTVVEADKIRLEQKVAATVRQLYDRAEADKIRHEALRKQRPEWREELDDN